MAVRLTPARAVAWVAKLLAGRSGTRWVGIDGLGAAGKTTLAEAIAAALPGAVVVSVDDFARPGVATWDHELFRREVLEPVLQGRPGSYDRWDLMTDRAGARVAVPVGVPIVVEGVRPLTRRAPRSAWRCSWPARPPCPPRRGPGWSPAARWSARAC